MAKLAVWIAVAPLALLVLFFGLAEFGRGSVESVEKIS